MSGHTHDDPEEARLLETLMQKARSLRRNGDTSEEAIEVNTEILRIDSNNSGAYVRRGSCHVERDNLDAAEEDFRRALKSNPESSVALRKLSEVQRVRHKLGEDEALRQRWYTQGLAWSAATPTCTAYNIRRIRSGYGYREPTPLCMLGYSITDPVSRRTLSSQERWLILVGNALPRLGLCEVAWTIANNNHDKKRNAREKYSYAIAQWEYDLARLKRVFYHEAVAAWPWPPTEPM